MKLPDVALACVPLVVLLLAAVLAEPQDAVDGSPLTAAAPDHPAQDADEEDVSPAPTPSPEPQDQDAVNMIPESSADDSDKPRTDSTSEHSAQDAVPKPSPAPQDAVDDTPAEPSSNRSATEWFRMGVDAYLSENWSECSRALENAVVEWHHYRRANVDCRLQCGAEARRAEPLFPEDVEHLRFAEEMVRATLCILKCKRRAFRGRATPDALPPPDQKTFRDLKPYEYLQLCYYQASEIQKAASAVFTIISHDPQNEIMRHNFKFYLTLPQVDVKNIINYESEKYISLFHMGTEAYYLENYGSAISNLEASLKEFLKANDECRAECEGPFDQGWLPDFTSSVANHFVYCLKCKAKCHSKLSQMNGEKYEDFLPTHYNYLQFAYFKMGKLKEACAATATYLMFFPADETMLENIEYYKSLPEVETSMFQLRPEAENYLKRQTYEDALLRYISDEFVFEETDDKTKIPPSEEIHGERSGDQFTRNDVHQLNQLANGNKVPTTSEKGFQPELVHLASSRANNKSSLTKLSQEFEKQEEIKVYSAEKQSLMRSYNLKERKSSKEETLKLQKDHDQLLAQLRSSSQVMTIFNFRGEDEMGGIQRFAVDGVAKENECKHMVQFAKAGSVTGDGYDGNTSPHSPRENFEGVTLGRAALLVHFGLIKLSTLHLFLQLSERGRRIVAAYFNIPSNDLHFSYTHLVCRSAKPGEPFNSSLFSHEIHADNCWLQKDGNCIQEDPAYYWRDYSALLYLNDDFEGGEFIFSEDPAGENIQSSIKPTCGRLVGFSSGRENLHGVQAVEHGTRCALALWFTLDPRRVEWGRSLTEEMIKNFKLEQQPASSLLQELQNLVDFDLKEAQKQILQPAMCLECTKEVDTASMYEEETKDSEFIKKSNVIVL